MEGITACGATYSPCPNKAPVLDTLALFRHPYSSVLPSRSCEAVPYGARITKTNSDLPYVKNVPE